MKQRTLIAYPRTGMKKGGVGRLRREGKIPAIVYGQKEPLSLSVNEHEYSKNFQAIGENAIVTIKLDDREINVLVKDYQYDIVTGKIIHIDFYEIDKDKAVRTHVPIHLEGIAQGVRDGGILEYGLHSLEVECKPMDIPETLVIDVTGLKLGTSIHVSDLKLAESVKVLTSAEQVVAVVVHQKKEKVEEAPAQTAEAAAAAAAPAPDAAAKPEDKAKAGA